MLEGITHLYEMQEHLASKKPYKDVKSERKGPQAESDNLGAQVGMAHTDMSNTGLCKSLLSANTPAPSKTSMQASANKVRKAIIQANQKDMAQKRT